MRFCASWRARHFRRAVRPFPGRCLSLIQSLTPVERYTLCRHVGLCPHAGLRTRLLAGDEKAGSELGAVGAEPRWQSGQHSPGKRSHCRELVGRGQLHAMRLECTAGRLRSSPERSWLVGGQVAVGGRAKSFPTPLPPNHPFHPRFLQCCASHSAT